MHDEALGGRTGHDGAGSLGHGAGELHDLGVPDLVRDVSLSVLGDVLLSGRAPSSNGSNVSEVLVVHGSGLERTTGLAFLVHADLLTTGVSGSAPVFDNLTFRYESLGVGLLVRELVKEVLGALAHLGVEHLSLNGGRESDVADESGVKSGSLLSSNDDSVSSELGRLGTFVGRESVSDVHVGLERSSSTDSVVMTDNSGGNFLGVVTSGDVSSTDSESSSHLNSLSLERKLLASHVDTSGVLGSSGNSSFTSDNVFGVSEVSSSELGVPGEHVSLEDNLASVFSLGSEHLDVSKSGKVGKMDSSALVVSGECEVLNGKFLLDSHGDLSTDGSSVVIGSLQVNSSLLFLESLVFSNEVDSLNLEATGNSLPVSGSSEEDTVLGSGVSSDLGLFVVNNSHLVSDHFLEVSLLVVVNRNSLLSSSEGNGVRVLSSEDFGHLLGADSEGNLSLSVGNGLHLHSESVLSSAKCDLLVVNSLEHLGLSNSGEVELDSLDSSGGNSSNVEFVVDTSPVSNSLGHGMDLSHDNSVGVSKSQPDGSHVSLLDELVVVISSSNGELDLELFNLKRSSDLGSLVLSNSESVDPDFVVVTDLDHDSLSLKSETVHVGGSTVGLEGKHGSVLSLGNEHDLSLDSKTSSVLGNSAVVDGDSVGSDGEHLGAHGNGESSSGKFVLVVHVLVVSDHGSLVDDSLLHGDESDSHGSSGNSSLSSVVDHVFVGMSRTDVGGLSLSEGDHLESKSVEVLMVGDSGKSLGSDSESGGVMDLDSPRVDDSSIVGHGSSGVSFSESLVTESHLGSVAGKSELVERSLEDDLGVESELVHSVGSSLTTDGLSVVVEGNTLGVFAHLSLTDKSSLGSNLELESSSHDSGSSGESLDRGGSLSFSSVLGSEGTTGQELGVASGTDGSLLFGVGVSSGHEGFVVRGVSDGSGVDGTLLSLESEVFSSVSADLSLLPGHHGGVLDSHLNVFDSRSVLHELGSLSGSDQSSHVVLEECDGTLHDSPVLVSEFLHLTSSGDLDGEVSSSSDHDSQVVHLFGDHSLEVSLGTVEGDVGLSEDNGDSTEDDLGVVTSGSHVVHSALGIQPSLSPLGHVDSEAVHGLLGLLPFNVDLSHPGVSVLHLLSSVELLGLVMDRDPVSLRLFVSVDGSRVGLVSDGEHVSGTLVVTVSSLLEGFHLVSSSASLEHGGVHDVVGVFGLSSHGNVVHPVLGGVGNLNSPVFDKSLSLVKLVEGNVLGLDGDVVSVVISNHISMGEVSVTDSEVSSLSGGVSLGFPVSSEFLGGFLFDLLSNSDNSLVVPDFVSVMGSLDSGDSGNLGSDEVHLGLGGESLLVDHDAVSSSLLVEFGLKHLSGVLNGDLPFVVLRSGVLLSFESEVMSASSDFDLKVSLLDGLEGSVLGDLSGGVGDLGLLDFAELSGVFFSGFTGGNTSEVSVSVGSLLGSNGKTDGGSLLGVGNTSVLDAELELQAGDVSESSLVVESDTSIAVHLLGNLEGSVSHGLEVGHVSHSSLSMASLNSSVMESLNNGGSSSELGLVGCDVVSLVLSGSGVDILELSSLGADESGLVEAVSVHPVRSTDDSDTSRFSTLDVIGLAFTPVLELEGLAVDPSVTRLGLAGTDPVSLDVRLDHVLNLELFLRGENRYELTAPFAANTSGVVPGLLLFEDFKVSNNLVGDSLEVSGLGSGLAGSLGFHGSDSSLLFGKSSGSPLSGFSFLHGLDLGSGGTVGLSFLDFGVSSSGSSFLSSGLLLGKSSFLSVSLLFLGEFLSLIDSLDLSKSFGSKLSGSSFLSSHLFVSSKLGFSSGSSLGSSSFFVSLILSSFLSSSDLGSSSLSFHFGSKLLGSGSSLLLFLISHSVGINNSNGIKFNKADSLN